MEVKLQDITTYVQLEKDPTINIKRSLSNKIKEIYDKKEMEYAIYRKLLPTQTQIPRIPMREIVDGNGGVLKEVYR